MEVMHKGLPVLVNHGAAKFGFATKLIPVINDGVHDQWEEVHYLSHLTKTIHQSYEYLESLGYRIDQTKILNY